MEILSGDVPETVKELADAIGIEQFAARVLSPPFSTVNSCPH